jgi:hypothetical protein
VNTIGKAALVTGTTYWGTVISSIVDLLLLDHLVNHNACPDQR